jgi:hypothetical protein
MNNKKLLGRPKLQSGKRIKIVNVRFTEEEYKTVIQLEQTLGISKTEIFRQKVLKDGLTHIVNAKELIAHLDAIGAELGRSGNNINQLARHANILQKRNALTPDVAIAFNLLMAKYLQQQKELETALRKIIRAMLYR